MYIFYAFVIQIIKGLCRIYSVRKKTAFGAFKLFDLKNLETKIQWRKVIKLFVIIDTYSDGLR